MKHFHPFRLDTAEETLWQGESRISLTHKAFALLRCLVDRAGRVVSRDALLEAVWPDTHVHPDNVKVLIGEIRRALGDNHTSPTYIRSIPKRGYVFMAPIFEAPPELSPGRLSQIFVGRHAEQKPLASALESALAGDRRLVFITGTGGMGKTALCETFLRSAGTTQGMRATWSQCLKHSGPSEPYYPLLDALVRLTRAAGDESIAALLAQHAPSWIPHLPTLRHDGAHGSGTNNLRLATPARMLREIVAALEALAQDELLVIWLDDIQWADPATVDVLASLGQRRDPARLLVIATMRPLDAAATTPLRRICGDLLAHNRAADVMLQPLSIPDVQDYLQQRFGRHRLDSIAEPLRRSTEGNPLYLVTAVDRLVEKGHIIEGLQGWEMSVSPDALEALIPVSLAGVLSKQIEDLTRDELLALESASVVGTEFSLWASAIAAERDEISLEATVESLSRRQAIITRDGMAQIADVALSPKYRFRHALYHDLVFDGIPTAWKAKAHDRIGSALESAFAGRESEVAADLARHFHGSGDHRKAAGYLRLAAKNALLRYAPRESAALLHGASAHLARTSGPDRLEMELTVMLELAQAQHAAGEPGLAASTLQRMERLAVETARDDDLVRAHLGLAQVHVSLARDRALHYANAASEGASRASDPMLVGSATIQAGLIKLYFGGWSDALADRIMEALDQLPPGGGPEKRSLTIRALFVHNMRSSYAAAWNVGRKLLAASLRSGDLADCLQNYHSASLAALHLGRWLDAHRVAGEGAALADKVGASLEAASLRLLQAWVALEAQRCDDAHRLALGDRELLETCGCIGGLQMSLALGGASSLALGRIDEASTELERLRQWQAANDLILDWFWKILLHISLAEIALAQRDPERATLEAAAAIRAADATAERTWRSRAHSTAALVAVERRFFTDAERELRLARREIRGIEAPLASWRIDAVAATLMDRTARPESARRARARYERSMRRLKSVSLAENPPVGPPDGPPLRETSRRQVH
jgi:DNA-binding winged helix-turn-helix (wHTH) protein